MEISLLLSAYMVALPLEVWADVAQQLRKTKQGLAIEVNMSESTVYIPTRASKL
jgi:hypothetical protein